RRADRAGRHDLRRYPLMDGGLGGEGEGHFADRSHDTPLPSPLSMQILPPVAHQGTLEARVEGPTFRRLKRGRGGGARQRPARQAETSYAACSRSTPEPVRGACATSWCPPTWVWPSTWRVGSPTAGSPSTTSCRWRLSGF